MSSSSSLLSFASSPTLAAPTSSSCDTTPSPLWHHQTIVLHRLFFISIHLVFLYLIIKMHCFLRINCYENNAFSHEYPFYIWHSIVIPSSFTCRCTCSKKSIAFFVGSYLKWISKTAYSIKSSS